MSGLAPSGHHTMAIFRYLWCVRPFPLMCPVPDTCPGKRHGRGRLEYSSGMYYEGDFYVGKSSGSYSKLIWQVVVCISGRLGGAVELSTHIT